MKKLNVRFAGLMGSYDVVMGSVTAYSVVFLEIGRASCRESV